MCVNVFQIECEFYRSKDSILQKMNYNIDSTLFVCFNDVNK